jgi:hypothetical protein
MKTWRDGHELNPWLFPLPSELARDSGPIGLALQEIPDELLRDADRCPDPWQDLRTNRILMVGRYIELFTACASVLPATVELAKRVYSRGELVELARRAKTESECEAVNRKLFPKMCRTGAGLLREAAAQHGSNMLKEFEKCEAALKKMMAKKCGKAALATHVDKPSAEPLRQRYPLLYLMVENWLRCGFRGDPGFMFYSDEALADLFSLFDWQGFSIAAEDLNSEQLEKMRGRLGLRKAVEKLPLITSAKMKFKTGVIELNTNDATIAKYEWPSVPVQLNCRIEISGRVLYRGLNS